MNNSYIVTSAGGSRMRYEGYIFRLKVSQPAFDDALEKYKKLAASSSAKKVDMEEKQQTTNDVFIVHGHNDGIKQKVARFLEQLGLKPIILHEQPNGGKTIIEKFEENANKVGFAVVLMTDDDFGGMNGQSATSPRSRQNVVLEQGYFIGSLGRKRVCTLYVDGVELPSDLLGVLYIKLDENDAWKLQLAREIKAGGISIDLNNAI